ncbi:secreted RxLR effector protein 161-like [Vicia villosa]|uniref:secreted RxLR effector protein 161-like n=1 Tax=Vicia villosa TaxID=3911 RepID=UPI00273AAA31|nr:secreted RxLR effector protein 161-like [Vicia villosa]
MESCNAVKNPIVVGTKLIKDEGGTEVDATLFKQMVGSLIYLTVTRPNLMYVVSLISKYISRPTASLWIVAKRILRYLKGTTELGIFYKKGEENVKLLVFTDSGHANDLDDRRSTSGYMLKIGHGVVS